MRYEYYCINRRIIRFYVGIKRLFCSRNDFSERTYTTENLEKSRSGTLALRKISGRKVFSSLFLKKRYEVRILLHKSTYYSILRKI